MGFMVHVCARRMLAELGAAHPNSHLKTDPVGKVKKVWVPLIQIWWP